MVGWIQKNGKKQMDGGWIDRIEKIDGWQNGQKKIYEKNGWMDGWILKKIYIWMVGWIEKKMDGWMDGKKIYEKKYRWLDG